MAKRDTCAMASANLDLVRSLYEAWSRGDWSGAEWADPDIELTGADGPDPISVRGRENLGAAWAEFLDAWEGWTTTAEEFKELDDGRILVFTTWGGRGKGSGMEVDEMRTKGANLFHLKDGKVTKLVLYWNRDRALAAAGLDPDAAS